MPEFTNKQYVKEHQYMSIA